jgi:hypothetical protein
MGNPPDLPSKTNDEWNAHLASATAITNNYAEDDWNTLFLDIQDITPLFSDPVGLAVLVADHEFEQLEKTVETTSIDTTHVYRNHTKETHYLIIAAEASSANQAIIIPAFLHNQQFERLQSIAQNSREIHTTLRSLGTDARVTITHDDPTVFF